MNTVGFREVRGGRSSIIDTRNRPVLAQSFADAAASVWPDA